MGDIIAPHVIDVFSKYSLLFPVRTKNPQEVRNSWIRVSGPPLCGQMDEDGEWENDLWAELRRERRIKLLFQGVGARPMDD